MSPELLLLLKIYAYQQTSNRRMIELLASIYSTAEGVGPEPAALFLKEIADGIDTDSDLLLKNLLKIFQISYPEVFGSETIEALLKRISLS